MAPSQRRLAKLADVSTMTVSRALRGHEGVSDGVRQRIVRLARQQGYPLPRSRPQNTLELLHVMCSMVAAEDHNSESSFNGRILAGLGTGAQECGSELINCSEYDRAWPLVVARQQVDGAVALMGNENSPHPPFPAPVPAVFIFMGPEDADQVTVDHFGGARALGLHLGDLGHRRVAYLGPETQISRKRLAGLRTGLEMRGCLVPAECVRLQIDAGGRESAVQLVDGLLESFPAPHRRPDGFSAMMVYNDYMAAAVILRLRERGLRVPEDLSVVGFDAVSPSWYEGPALTTSAMPLEEIGAEAVRFLHWRLAHPSAPRRRLVLSTEFVNGQTVESMVP